MKWGGSSLVERLPEEQSVGGSIPLLPTKGVKVPKDFSSMSPGNLRKYEKWQRKIAEKLRKAFDISQ